MIKTIDVAGIQLDNYTVREAIMDVERDMSDQGFHTIEEVNTDTLMLAASDEAVRETLMTLEHTVISEVSILEAVGAGNYQRRHEVEHHDFFYELMRRIERNHKTVYLIGDTEVRTAQMQESLEVLYPKVQVAGVESLDHWDGAIDAVINEMNAATPDVIISMLPSPMQEHFLLENKDKLSANLWYGMGNLDPAKDKRGILHLIRKVIRTHKLEKQIHSYSQENA